MIKDEKIRSILHRGVEDIIQKDSLQAKLNGRKKLRVKLGFDPTSPNIHIGNAATLLKVRQFQDLGHTAVFIVGDFTARIGDNSDKESERPILSEEEIQKNVKTYFKQAFTIIDESKTETYYNSQWLSKLGFSELCELANLFSVHDFISRELVKKRLDSGKRVSLRELMYPIMQGYDSAAVKADVEIGGTDQRFNMLSGRVIQEYYGQKPQDVLMISLLEGTDGRKMSKSWGNVINILDEPSDMFGKAMTIPDALIERYFSLATKTLPDQVDKIKENYNNPRDQKIILASAITELYYGADMARIAQENFVSRFTRKELPSKIEEVKVKPGKIMLSDLLVKIGLSPSKTHSKRLISQNGVKINEQVAGEDAEIKIAAKNELLVQVGKRNFRKIV